MKPGFFRTLSIVISIVTGLFVPQAHVAVGAVRWIIMGMLFMVFLRTRFSRESVHPTHLVLLLANLVLGAAGFGLGWMIGGQNIALAGFFTGITPTAIAAPVIMSFLRGRVDYVVTAFMLSNVFIAALLPFVLPWVLGHPTPDVFLGVLGTIGGLVFLPFAAGTALRAVYPPAAEWPARLGTLTFLAWNVTLFLIVAHSSHYLRTQHEIPARLAWEAAGLSALLCAAGFGLGRLIGGRKFAREASQSLGQKNTTFTIYLAMAYANPLVALGPTAYVLWHNLWNSWQLYRDRGEPR
jgi:BASS family bile acid:Na+ symporter